MTTARSRAEQHIEKLLQQVEPGSTRHHLLSRARSFKASWIELGELLCQVRHEQLYRQWGYTDFASYCREEIRIRQQTADKLTQAYHYLEREAPQALTDDLGYCPPDFRSLHLLQQIEAEGQLPAVDFEPLRQSVLTGQLSHPGLSRQLRELNRRQEDLARQQDLKAALQAARRLHNSLLRLGDCSQLSSHLPLIDSLVAELQQLQTPDTLSTCDSGGGAPPWE